MKGTCDATESKQTYWNALLDCEYTTQKYIFGIYISRFVYPWTLVFISVSAALTFAAAASVLLQYSRWQLEKFIEPTCGRLSPATLRAAFPAIMTPLIFEPSSRWKCCQSSGCAGCCSRQSAGKRLRKAANVALLQSPGHNWQPASLGLGNALPFSSLSLLQWKTKGCRTHKTDDRILLCSKLLENHKLPSLHSHVQQLKIFDAYFRGQCT